MVASSVSPDRAEMMEPYPTFLAASKAALVSEIVPAWFGLTSTALLADALAAYPHDILQRRLWNTVYANTVGSGWPLASPAGEFVKRYLDRPLRCKVALT